MIDEIGPLAMKKVPLIELRSLALGETVYVQPHDIICATSDSYNTRVRLSLEGRSEIVVPGQAYVTFMSVTGNPYFVPTHDANGFVNTAHVKKVSPFRIEMDDGTAVRTTPHYAGLVRKQMQWLSE
jgi:hypothetical protein